jgi:hypothetical protein
MHTFPISGEQANGYLTDWKRTFGGDQRNTAFTLPPYPHIHYDAVKNAAGIEAIVKTFFFLTEVHS